MSETIAVPAQSLAATASQAPIIDVAHVHKSVTDSTGTLEILRDIDFTLAERETVAIVGASGSGKSTLLSIIAGLGLAQTAQAAEGMWVPQQLPEIAGPLKQAGLKLDPQQLANLTGDPMGAVVALGGCTASFVSPGGLVVTMKITATCPGGDALTSSGTSVTISDSTVPAL